MQIRSYIIYINDRELVKLYYIFNKNRSQLWLGAEVSLFIGFNDFTLFFNVSLEFMNMKI